MHLSTLLEQLPQLHAITRTPTPTQQDLLLLETNLRATLENIAPHRLVSATVPQQETYFSLLDTYAQDVTGWPVASRQQLAADALRLCQALAHLPEQL